MTNAKKISFSGILVAIMLAVSIPLFSACGETQCTYSEFQLAYQDYVSDYTGEIFDNNGYVNIVYDNASLQRAIDGTTITDKMNLFTRLTDDTSSDQAIFEPTLKASLMYVKTYINVTIGIEVPTNVSTQLNNSLNTLRECTDAFISEKAKLENRGAGFRADNAFEQATLLTLFNRYVDLILQAIDFSQQFIDAYSTYNTIPTADRADGRPAIGSINRFYLETLTTLADIYANVYLVNIYDRSHETSQNGTAVEYYTSFNYSSDLNSALESYLDIADIIDSFEAREGEMTSAERAVVIEYKRADNYDLLFQKGYSMVQNIIDNYDIGVLFELDNTELTDEQIGNFNNINDFFNCEYRNLTNMLNSLSRNIVSA